MAEKVYVFHRTAFRNGERVRKDIGYGYGYDEISLDKDGKEVTKTNCVAYRAKELDTGIRVLTGIPKEGIKPLPEARIIYDGEGNSFLDEPVNINDLKGRAKSLSEQAQVRN